MSRYCSSMVGLGVLSAKESICVSATSKVGPDETRHSPLKSKDCLSIVFARSEVWGLKKHATSQRHN
jgi:hypothetical protein